MSDADSKKDPVGTKYANLQERKLAQELYDKYAQEYKLESVSEKNALQQLIYFEVLQYRMQGKLNEAYSKDMKAVPADLVSTMHKNSDAILRIKETLGLHRKKEKQSGYDALEHLKQRFLKWCEENQGSRTLKCPHCMEQVLLKIRTDAWEAQKHPFFKDNMIYNKHLFANRGRTVLIDDKFIADCLEFSPDYVSWMVAKSQAPVESPPSSNAVATATD